MNPLTIPHIAAGSPAATFPVVDSALKTPNGLLASGGDLSAPRLLHAYRHGIFPWYHESEPILWWSPDPRAVIFPGDIHVSRSLRKYMRHTPLTVAFDTDFEEVISACAAPRRNQAGVGTWITPAMQTAYLALHRLGHAHSLEITLDGALVGGLYGIALGGVFFGESMFTRSTNVSKVALVCLARQLQAWGFSLIDCQIGSTHLTNLGSILIPRADFVDLLEHFTVMPSRDGPWHFELSLEF